MVVRMCLQRLLSSFAKDRRGNIAVITALAALPLMLAIGGAVDIGIAYRAKARVQSAADSAALAAVTYAGSDEAQRKRDADIIFAQGVSGMTIDSSSLTKSGENWVYQATYRTANSFLRLIHLDSFAANVSATATVSNAPLDIVLVLDSSGSMADDNKMVELKKAVTQFLALFEGGKKTQVALVPFDSQVKAENSVFGTVGSLLVTNPFGATGCATVTDPNDQTSCQQNQTLSTPILDCSQLNAAATFFDRQKCGTSVNGFKAGTSATYTSSLLPLTNSKYTAAIASNRYTIVRQDITCILFCFSGSSVTIYDATGAGRQPVTTKGNLTETSNNDLIAQIPGSWPKCFVDRTQPYDTTDAPMTIANKDTVYPEASCATGTLQPVTGLTNMLTTIDTAAQKLQPAGNTDITIGIQWGLEALTSAYPLSGASSDPAVQKVIVLLTDGLNTQNRWWGSDNRTKINARTLAACDYAKASKIQMFTVRLITGDEDLLRSCASDPTMYRSASSAAEVPGMFTAIANIIRTVRIVS